MMNVLQFISTTYYTHTYVHFFIKVAVYLGGDFNLAVWLIIFNLNHAILILDNYSLFLYGSHAESFMAL